MSTSLYIGSRIIGNRKCVQVCDQWLCGYAGREEMLDIEFRMMLDAWTSLWVARWIDKWNELVMDMSALHGNEWL